MSLAVLIPARGGSKGIPGKNWRELCCRPLIQWAVRAAVACEGVDAVYVSTDTTHVSDAVHALNAGPKVQVISRSEAGAIDGAPSEVPLLEFARTHAYDWIALVQATSPFIQSKDIDRAIHVASRGYDSVVSLTRRHYFPWGQLDGGAVKPVYDMLHRPRRQDWPGILVENGAMYLSKRDRILASMCRLSGRIGHIEMPDFRSIELDTEADFAMAEALYGKDHSLR